MRNLLAVLGTVLILGGVARAESTPEHAPPAPQCWGEQCAPTVATAQAGPRICPQCKTENAPNAKFCVECGKLLQEGGCPRCHAPVKPGQKFCSECGLNLVENPPQGPGSPTPTPTPTPTPGGPPTTPAGPGGMGSPSPDVAGPNGITYPTFQLRGFSDVSFRAQDGRTSNNSFALGQLDLFITSQLSPRLSVLSENVVEANDQNAFGFEIERLLLQYQHSDWLNIAFGRYHTAIGYYNTAFHHSTWMQTAAGRPFLFAFEDEGGILPVHNVGLSMNGRIPSGAAGLRYILEVGNGQARGRGVEPVQSVIDENEDKSVNLGLISRPDFLPGLQAGVSVYRDRLHPPGRPGVNQLIPAAHVVYNTPTFEWLNEALLLHHDPSGPGRTSNIPGFYTQVSRQFGKWRPYFRFQYVNGPKYDPLFPRLGLRYGPSFGLRYDLSDFAALKLQYDRTEGLRTGTLNEIIAQAAFTF